MSINNTPQKTSIFFDESSIYASTAKKIDPEVIPEEKARAIIYSEGFFSQMDGKEMKISMLNTYEKNYKVISYIDSEEAGADVGKLLFKEASGMPVFRDLGTALAQAGRAPKYFVFSDYTESCLKPGSTERNELTEKEKRLIIRVLEYGINVVIGLHESLNKDEQIIAACAKKNVVVCGNK